MIIAIVAIELFASLFLALMIAVGSGGRNVATAPLDVWLALAILKLTIYYLPRVQNIRYVLSLVVALSLLAGLLPGRVEALPYIHQSLFIASLAVLPQFWVEWFSQDTRDRSLPRLIRIAALPLGIAAWGIGNIWIVKAEAWTASHGDPHCIFLSNGNLSTSGYHEASNDLSLSGWNMVSGRGGGGSGNCCQWDFHALLKMRDNRLFNWSYESQRFERVSDRTTRLMNLSSLICQ